ncbi:hypothetical protein P171DRAFT_516712 [Karstenula rhodostoma CBS 690.94]|uniref:C2H2-type domain-containing protein n=1 Tax=Karstenula rhodostoma CBS 690.94 TaxID=1392251 RepID=A0A9P4UI81_9PLEO|nr:hypothetical protein P171DRAFT_516712 [Karstenula rhodostoma CBS 690.94]
MDLSPFNPTPEAGSEVGTDNNLPFDVAHFGIFGDSQAEVNQGVNTIDGPEATVGDFQFGLGLNTLPPRAGVHFGHNQFAANDVGTPLENIQPYVATDTSGFSFENTVVNFAEPAPLFPNSDIQMPTHEPGHNPYAPLGFGVGDLAATNFFGQPRVQSSRLLAPQPPLANAPSVVGLTRQPRSHRQSVYDCDVPGCAATFKRSAGFRRHKRTIHNRHEAPEFQCMVKTCSYTYPRHDKVREHMKRMHGICLRVEKE